MHLFLVRHGESVDNVAGLLAGSRDSPLTSHGVLQARRLGDHLASRSDTIGPVRYIFSSDLQRAVKTAEAIVGAQLAVDTKGDQISVLRTPLTITQLAELREKDFRSSEGTHFGARAERGSESNKAVDTESFEEMMSRAYRFVDVYLANLLQPTSTRFNPDQSVVIVAHGIILNVLLRCILARFAPSELERLSRPWSDSARGTHYLAAWSNTAYLEIMVENTGQHPCAPSNSAATCNGQVLHRLPVQVPNSSSTDMLPQLRVLSVNSITHLRGLKRTKGGIGSAKFDERQRTMEAYFVMPPKRPKIASKSED